MECEFYILVATNTLGTSSLAFCTTLASQWQKARRHTIPGPPQAVEASCNGDAKELLPCSQLHHQGKCQCTTAITTVRLEPLWCFPESCAADDSGSEQLSNGGLS